MVSSLERCSRSLPRYDLVALVPVVAATVVYLPILGVYFYADDFHVLANLRDGRLAHFLLLPFGGHNLLVRNAAFALSFRAFGLRPELFQATVLATHALNVWLLFRVVRSLTGSAPLACAGAILWGVLPTHAGALGWYCVYGQVLSATVVLVVLDGVARVHASAAPLTNARAAGWWALLLVGTACFGTGIGAAIAFPAVVFLLVPEAWTRRPIRYAFLALPVVAFAGWLALRRLSALLLPLTLDEEMLERVLFHDPLPIAELLVHLVGFSMVTSVLGPLGPARYPSMVASGAIGVFVVASVFAWSRATPRVRRCMLALGALSVGIYTAIATGRANALAAFFHATMARGASTSRYHYAASIGTVVWGCLALKVLGSSGWMRRVPRWPLVAVGALIAIPLARQHVVIDDHGQAARWVTETTAAMRAESLAHPAGTIVHLENGTAPRFVLGAGLRPIVFPGRAALFEIIADSDTLEGRRLRFVERDAETLAWYRALPGSRLGRLLIAPEEPGTGAAVAPHERSGDGG